jgi:hypothetical protein
VSTVDEALGGLVARLTWSWDPQGWDDTYQEAGGVGGVFEVTYTVEGTEDGSSWIVPCPARSSENTGFYPVEPAEFVFCITYKHRSADGIVTASPASVGVTSRFDG